MCNTCELYAQIQQGNEVDYQVSVIGMVMPVQVIQWSVSIDCSAAQSQLTVRRF